MSHNYLYFWLLYRFGLINYRTYQILSQPHWQNRFTPEDYRALTTLFSGHINPYGLFPLDFSKRLSIGIII